MQIVIDILEDQIKISKERLKTNHYPKPIEQIVKKKIEACEDAIEILNRERLNKLERPKQ